MYYYGTEEFFNKRLSWKYDIKSQFVSTCRSIYKNLVLEYDELNFYLCLDWYLNEKHSDNTRYFGEWVKTHNFK